MTLDDHIIALTDTVISGRHGLDETLEAVEEWITAILDAGPKAVRLQKELIGYWEKMSVSDGIQEGIRSIGKAYETDEPFRMLSAQIKKLQNR